MYKKNSLTNIYIVVKKGCYKKNENSMGCINNRKK